MTTATTTAIASSAEGTSAAPTPPPEAYATALAGLPGMGPARLWAVLSQGPPAEAWAHVAAGRPWIDPSVVEALGARAPDLIARWHEVAAVTDVAALGEAVAAAGMAVTIHGGAGYPDVLTHDVEPPAVLFHVGALDHLAGPRVAVVGTRRCSPTGAGVAFELGRDLAAAGVRLVSGLAAGIDGAAHRGALAAGTGAAPPIGVVGSGLDVVYPTRHHDLWHAVARAGLLLSEAPPGARPERWRFPARNRIIAALSDLVVVVESHRRGGSLHTVDEADRRGVDVLAVPGSVRNPAAAGTNDLLAEGRAPACSATDVLMALGLNPARHRDQPDPRPPPDPADQPVLDAVGWQPATLDHIAARAALGLTAVAPALDRLVDTGWVVRRGGWFERTAAATSGEPGP
jgi:DNA processing protein